MKNTQHAHSAFPERFEDAKPKKPQHDVIKVGREAKHAGVIKALKKQGYKC